MTKESSKKLCKELAEESFVLLKNEENCLPLLPQKVAFFGRSAYKPCLGGRGSGMTVLKEPVDSIVSACEKKGMNPVAELDRFYREETEKEKEISLLEEVKAAGENLVASGIIYEIFGRYHAQPQEISVPDDLIEQAAKETDTAIYTLGRETGGEECDRRLKDDYELSEIEKALVENISRKFARVILLLNVNGVCDLSFFAPKESIKAILWVGTPGGQGTTALSEVLSGEKTPSGKLAFTIASAYEDYPSARHFSFDKDNSDMILEYKDYGLNAEANGSHGFAKSPVTVYQEGIYIGYRYFDSFEKAVLYPFGFGLSYADFSMEIIKSEKTESGVRMMVEVQNLSETFAGKEVVEVYLSIAGGRLHQPYQKLVAFEKTGKLQPGEKEEVSLFIPWEECISYAEERAAWVMEAGTYLFRVGNSSRNTKIGAKLCLKKEVLYKQVNHALVLQQENYGKIKFLIGKPNPIQDGVEKNCIHVKEEEMKLPVFKETVSHENVSPEIKRLSDRQLASLLVGYGPGLPFGGLGVPAPATLQDEKGKDVTKMTHPNGKPGYVSPALPEYGIPSVCYKDGPAGIGKTAWPTQMLTGCSWNKQLLFAFGNACGEEAKTEGVDCWLAPALNLQRNPLGGRNFEYFSEDPYLTGALGRAVCLGVAENEGVTTCPKHFALNEQETYRRGNVRKQYDAVDSIVEERTAREIYLKPFEMVVKSGKVQTLMTSFNKINGIFAAANADLCEEILRKEWGFTGVVITDWGDMDIVADGADMVAAGNDIVMPGGPSVSRQILKGMEEKRVTRKQMEEAGSRFLIYVKTTGSYKIWMKKQEKKKE